MIGMPIATSVPNANVRITVAATMSTISLLSVFGVERTLTT